MGCFFYLDTSILLNLEAPQNAVMQMPFLVFPRLYVTGSTLGKEASAFSIHQLQDWTPITPKHLAAATATDPVLYQVVRYCWDGWPATVTTDLQPYHQKQAELGGGRVCVLWNSGCHSYQTPILQNYTTPTRALYG